MSASSLMPFNCRWHMYLLYSSDYTGGPDSDKISALTDRRAGNAENTESLLCGVASIIHQSIPRPLVLEVETRLSLGCRRPLGSGP